MQGFDFVGMDNAQVEVRITGVLYHHYNVRRIAGYPGTGWMLLSDGDYEFHDRADGTPCHVESVATLGDIRRIAGPDKVGIAYNAGDGHVFFVPLDKCRVTADMTRVMIEYDDIKDRR